MKRNRPQRHQGKKAPTPQSRPDAGPEQRLNQILSLAGVTSRRRADEYIKSGRVKVNGRRVTQPGTRAVWGVDQILVDGEDIPGPSHRTYVMLNKPFGYICALSDPAERPLVTDLLKGVSQRVYPVGRLDFDTLGLLLLTNDGQWAHRLAHPRYRVPKTYKIKIQGAITDTSMERLRKGVRLKDGPSGPSKATLISQDHEQSLIRMTLTSGRSRQVRRMLEAVGYRVIHLKRTGFGPLTLGRLKVGDYRHLETEEVKTLNRLVGLE